MKKILLVLALIILCISIFSSSIHLFDKFPGYPRKSVVINNQTMELIHADTELRKTIGLSGSAPLKDNEGMLFTFKDPGRYGFWMKDMKYAIDLIYLKDSKVSEIIRNAKPSSYPHIFLPKQEFDAMIEVTTGTADKIGIHIGNKVIYNDK